MNIFDFEENILCSNCTRDYKEGFSYQEVLKGNTIEVKDKKEHHILFILSGSLSVTFNEFADYIFSGGEIIFLPKSSDCKGAVVTDAQIVVLSFNLSPRLCNKTVIESLAEQLDDITYEFKSLPIRQPLNEFLNLLVLYLRKGICCDHLHQLKQSELSIILLRYYSNEEIILFFYHAIGKSMDFKNKILANYLRVKTAKELAQACGYEYRTFLRLFHQYLKQTPYQWMRQQTARHIKGKLANKDISIKAIALEYGFSSAAHFTTYCKKHLGSTPLKIRNKKEKIDREQ